MALPDVYKINVQTRVDDRLCSFGIHYRVSSGGDPVSDASNLALGFDAENVPALLSCLADDATLEGLYVTCFEPETALPFSKGYPSTPGLDTTGACPSNMAAVFTLQISSVAAKRHGRIYVAGFSKSKVEDGLWKSSFVAAQMQNLANKIKATFVFGGATFVPGVVRTISLGLPITPVFDDLISVRPRQVPYSQRRRTSKQRGFAA